MAPQLSIKLVVFSIIDDKLRVFFKDKNLPVGFPQKDKSLDNSALSILQKYIKTSILDDYVEQLYTISSAGGGKAGIAVVYYILMPGYSINRENKSNWIDCDNIGKNMSEYDVISYAVQRLRWKVEYTNVVYSLLLDEFTLSQLQKVYEAILGRELDKRNFRKKILSLGLLKSTGKKKKGEVARPATVFSFKSRKPEFVKVFS
ncbi:hypothetical protein M1271_06950 [Patescibacteria group bacterium]|nr:hypothetical protein [Patescibacteria group bacterium]MCL5797454.1 hypothetical protein [Patescibacteria group bacterium]